jgi:predicted ATPase
LRECKGAIVISSIEINRLRGIREGKLADLTPLVVLVGPNGSGKSTILDALFLGASSNPADAVGQVIVRREELTRGARWLLWKGGNDGSAEITLAAGSALSRHASFVFRTAVEAPAVIQGVIRTKQDGNDITASGFVTTFEQRSPYQILNAPQIPWLEVPEVRFVDPRAAGLSTPLHKLYTKIVEKGLRKEALEAIQTLIPKIEDIQILAEGDTPILYLIYGDRAVPAALAGDGIRLLLHLSFELATHPGGLVLMEEPEAHMHPGAIHECARAIVAAVRRGVQVVLSTHSLELIDALLSECNDNDLTGFSVYSVKLDEGRLLSFRSHGEEIAFARTQIGEDLR